MPLKRKAATSSSKPNRVKMLGKLSSLLSLPLDIFFEICSHLQPLDLLHLSRASRHFARMFLGTQNRHAWLAARRTAEGLPDCPSDLSEARYAHLLFESICSGCGKIGRRLLFNLRVRFCASCYKIKVERHITVDEVDHPLDTVLQIVPHTYNVTDLSVMKYLEAQYKIVIDEFLRAMGGSSGDAFLQERQDAVSAIAEHGMLVSDLLEELQERKELEKLRLRVTRKLQIDARIMAMGYARHEIPVASTEYQEEIIKPKALTERAWRGMAYRMRGLAASRRAQNIKESVLARLREWLRVYASVYTRDDWATALNAAQTDVVTELLSEADAGIPFTRARFNAHAARISAEVETWRDTAKGKVGRRLAEVYGVPKGAGALHYASAVIRCGECERVLFAAGDERSACV
ncbi:hypothetical protein BJ912DRAFT_173036 [Pholiota molesta]|nr:hypothetical protein BJ912DRAFT_173036 [Pholiota molesta]